MYQKVCKKTHTTKTMSSIVHGIWKSAQAPKCLIVTKLKNENCVHCEQGKKA